MTWAGRGATLPRLLVASYFGPGWTSGGAVIVDGLLRDYPAARYRRFWVPLRTEARASPGAGALHVPGLIHPRWRRAASRVLWDVGSRIQARQAERLARAFDAQLVWSVLDYAWVPFTYRFMRRTSVPVHVSVHDDPVASAQLVGWPADVLRRLERAFEFCYREAASRDVISEAMRGRYLAAYARDAVVVTHGIADARPVVREPAASTGGRLQRARPLRIVHVGNLHYPDEAIRFAEAVHAHGGAELTLIGNPPAAVRSAADRLGIRLESWLPQAELNARLPDFDFAYLPYGFSPERRRFVETSFPTKLISYLNAGLPILHHGPAYSSVAGFLRTYRAGVLLDTMDPDALAAGLRRVEGEPYAVLREECARVARELFAHDVIFDRWLGELLRGATASTTVMNA
jgi:hypothetical protein